MIGDEGANRLTLTGCLLTAHGRGGNDRIVRTRGDRFNNTSCLGHLGPSHLDGGSGGDRLVGNEFTDNLTGGSGRDVATGGPGLGRCRAEVEKSCERD